MTRVPTHRLSPAAGTTSSDDDNPWARAACVDEDPELFFPDNTGGGGRYQTALAKSVCAACPVIDACLRWALDTGQDHGIWGGLSEDERRAMKLARARRMRQVNHAATSAEPPPPADDDKADPHHRPICGSHAGYTEHTRKRERQCDDCRIWKAENRSTNSPATCGTIGGYRRHLANKEDACGRCKTAKAVNSAQYRKQKRRAA